MSSPKKAFALELAWMYCKLANNQCPHTFQIFSFHQLLNGCVEADEIDQNLHRYDRNYLA